MSHFDKQPSKAYCLLRISLLAYSYEDVVVCYASWMPYPGTLQNQGVPPNEHQHNILAFSSFTILHESQ